MATTIQSGRSNSPLLTADVASRAEIFGGRSLVFDGVSDYLDCGTSTQSMVNDTVKSLTAWVKVDSSASNEKRIIVFHKGNNATRWGLGWNQSSNANKFFASYNPSDSHGRVYSSSTYSAGDGWHHV